MRNSIKSVLVVIAMLCGLLGQTSAQAQTTLTADWDNLGLGNFQAVSNGQRLTVGPNAVTITTRVNKDGDANDANFVPYYSSGMLSYYNGQVGAQSGVLFYSMDHSVFDAGDYFETIYTLDTAAQQMAFKLSNVDRYLTSPYFFHDGVTIEYDTGTGTWLNLRNLAGSYTLGGAVGTATLGGMAGFQGTAYTGGITSTTGDISVNFGVTTVKRVRIRYHFAQGSPTANPSGDYQYMAMSDLTWQQSGVSVADLSLTKTGTSGGPASGSAYSYTLTLTNNGPLAASGVIVRDLLPAGFSFSSTSGYGTYDPVTGFWTIASIASGQSRQLVISGTVTAGPGITVTNIAEVYSSLLYDTDSTPNNGKASEDDQAAVTFTVQGSHVAGIPPTLVCPVGTTFQDWDTLTWAAGSRSNSYSISGIGSVSFSVATNASGDPTLAGLPSLTTGLTGGGAAENTLYLGYDFATELEYATISINLPTAVPGAQFKIYDVDMGTDSWADYIVVTGYFQGTPVYPTLTNSASNWVSGNEAYGSASVANNSGDGNITVTFQSAVDTIVFTYGNHSVAPPDPQTQVISITDITYCLPTTDLTATKISTVISDPVSGTEEPKAIPGAVIEYCILLSNSGSATAENAVVTDLLPSELVFEAGSLSTGATCASATGAEDDDAAGADEADPYGASYDAGSVTASATSIGPSGTFAVKFRAAIQ